MSDLREILNTADKELREWEAKKQAAETRVNALLAIERELLGRRLPDLQAEVARSEAIVALKQQAKTFGES